MTAVGGEDSSGVTPTGVASVTVNFDSNTDLERVEQRVPVAALLGAALRSAEQWKAKEIYAVRALAAAARGRGRRRAERAAAAARGRAPGSA